MSKSQLDSFPDLAEMVNSAPPNRKFRQNCLLVLTGLYERPMKFLITVYEERDSSTIRLFRDADGGFHDGVSLAEQVITNDVLKLLETRPDDIFIRLKNEFGAANVFLIPEGGYLAARMLSEGISVFCVFDCDSVED